MVYEIVLLERSGQGLVQVNMKQFRSSPYYKQIQFVPVVRTSERAKSLYNYY